MDYYHRNARRLLAEYSAIDPDRLHATWATELPARAGRALDVGAGSGRDAYWLAKKGWGVVAVEPCEEMRNFARRKESGVVWIDDKLPDLASVPSHPYELILVSAVWMHLSPVEQRVALLRLQELLSHNGLLVISWRTGGDDQDRDFYPVQDSLFSHAKILSSDDQQGRNGIAWKTALMRKPSS